MEQFIVIKVDDNNAGTEIRRFARMDGVLGHMTVQSDKAWLWENKNFFEAVKAVYDEYMAGATSAASVPDSEKPKSLEAAQKER